jgi:hypothetical protein
MVLLPSSQENQSYLFPLDLRATVYTIPVLLAFWYKLYLSQLSLHSSTVHTNWVRFRATGGPSGGIAMLGLVFSPNPSPFGLLSRKLVNRALYISDNCSGKYLGNLLRGDVRFNRAPYKIPVRQSNNTSRRTTPLEDFVDDEHRPLQNL